MEQDMKDMGMDDNIEKKLQEAFEPAKLSTVYRDQLLQELISETWVMKYSKSRFWKKPELWVAVAVVVILAVTGYGIWLPYSVWDKLTS